MIGCCIDLVRATRSNKALHMSASFASLRTSCMSGTTYLISRALEVICEPRLKRSPIRGSFLVCERRERAAVRFCSVTMSLRTTLLPEIHQ